MPRREAIASSDTALLLLQKPDRKAAGYFVFLINALDEAVGFAGDLYVPADAVCLGGFGDFIVA